MKKKNQRKIDIDLIFSAKTYFSKTYLGQKMFISRINMSDKVSTVTKLYYFEGII